MNKQVEIFARSTLKEGLAQCTKGQQLLFKRMYSHKNLGLPIDEVVDNMDIDKLDNAMDQVKRTLDKVGKGKTVVVYDRYLFAVPVKGTITDVSKKDGAFQVSFDPDNPGGPNVEKHSGKYFHWQQCKVDGEGAYPLAVDEDVNKLLEIKRKCIEEIEWTQANIDEMKTVGGYTDEDKVWLPCWLKVHKDILDIIETPK